MTATVLRPLLALVLVWTALIGAPAAAQQAETPLSRDDVETIVREYLRQNPEVVIEAIEAYRAKQRLAEQQQRQQALAALEERIYNDPATPDNGVEDYDVTIIEFFDYQCHYCKKIFPDLMSVMNDDPKLRVVFKELPILGPASTYAAKAALAAGRQGKYMEMHIALMDIRGQLSEARVMRAAREIGLDTDLLAKDMETPEVEQQIRNNLNIAQQVGITGTPAMVVGTQFVPGAVDRATMLQLIETARDAKS